MKKPKLKFVLLFLWLGLIFFLSHQPNLSSGFSPEVDFAFRKAAHITEYAVLTLLSAWALVDFNISKKKFLTLSVLIPLLYAFSDEYHQSFIVGRVGTFNDVLIDSVGIILAFAVVWKSKIFFK